VSPPPIDPWHLALSAGFVLVAGLVSLGLRLGLEGKLLVASLRTVVQLLAVGYVLGWVFTLESPWVLALVLLVMIGAAAHAAVGRASRRFGGASLGAFVVLAAVGLATTLGATQLVLGVRPWW
jgi:putative ABC transport system permease protein